MFFSKSTQYFNYLNPIQLLQSFKIMDYSLLVGIHNLDQACQEQASKEAGAADQRRPQGQKSLYSTAIEAIQAEPVMGSLDAEDKWVPVVLWPYRGRVQGNFLQSVSQLNVYWEGW